MVKKKNANEMLLCQIYCTADNRKTSSNQNGSLRLNASKGTCSPKQDMTGDKNFVVVALRKGKKSEEKKRKSAQKNQPNAFHLQKFM